MLQIYFISVLANLTGGLFLILGSAHTDKDSFITLKNLVTKKSAQAVLGIIALLAGILKLFVYARAGSVPVLADLLPAIGGIGIGGSLILNVLFKDEAPGTSAGQLQVSLEKLHMPIGISGVVLAVLHFLFPGVILL
jgi:hypothetical protein